MTEVLALLDEAAIREVAGRPSGGEDLGIPKHSKLESVADPKRMLLDALVVASGLRGRRLKSFRQRFSTHRRLLLERLDPSGPVTALTCWKQFDADLCTALHELTK